MPMSTNQSLEASARNQRAAEAVLATVSKDH
ncbi:MAG: hypothetical protein JWM18_4287 [Chloroflexi bacterium]|jgi:hypothetical protein|nr:hypothetical protein [Chloroflexota bacterium]